MRSTLLSILLVCVLVSGLAATGALCFKQGRYMVYLVIGHHEGYELVDVRLTVQDSITWWVRATELDSTYFDYAGRRCFLRHAAGAQDSTGLPFLLFEAEDSTAVLTIDSMTVRGPFRWDNMG